MSPKVALFLKMYYLLLIYIVTSKPKRISSNFGLVHIIIPLLVQLNRNLTLIQAQIERNHTLDGVSLIYGTNFLMLSR